MTTPEPNSQQARQTVQKEEAAKSFSYLVYLERESPFPLPKAIQATPGTQVIQLRDLQRAIGAVEGTLISFDTETRRGELEVEGHRFPCVDLRWPQMGKTPVDLKELIGQAGQFSFWPTRDKKSKRTLLPELKLSRVRRDALPSPGYVEAIGKLTRLWSGGFEVIVRSRTHRRFFRVLFAGDYPYPDEVGQWVWVTGRFDPTEGVIRFEETEALAFVPQDEAAKILRRQEKKRRKKEAKARRKTESSVKLHKGT